MRKAGLIQVVLSILTLDFSKREDVLVPVLTTSEVININNTSAISRGTITGEGSGSV